MDHPGAAPSTSSWPPPENISSGRWHSRSRAQSVSSDRPSTIAHSLMSPPLSVSPEAAFIAASAASQIITNDHDNHADRWYDQHGIEPSGEPALVSSAALQLVNNFLDQLLFNFLRIAKSTSLVSLRPAVSEVLKPKLAKDAINMADEELHEYLGSGDDDDMLQMPEQGNEWDLELVWKRARLRCMVYSSFGDMEEDDEDYFMEQDQLQDIGHFSEAVPPAVAIFLTSILEFMGEQALIVAGQAAYHRMRVKRDKDLKGGLRNMSDVSDRITVEDLDMERVALDRTLGRIWRAWKKRIRPPPDHSLQRAFGKNSVRPRSHGVMHLREGSSTLISESQSPPHAKNTKEGSKITEAEEGHMDAVEEWVLASQIPLPLGDADVDEIEVPGLASHSDGKKDDVEKQDDKQRPKSLLILPTPVSDLPTPTMSQPVTPVVQTRKRSNSLPTPATSPYTSPPNRSKVEQQAHIQLVPESICEDPPVSIETRPEVKAGDESPGKAAADTTEEEENEADSDATSRPGKATSLPTSNSAAPIEPGAEESDAPPVEGEIEEFTEEPEVLNISRVSVTGRVSPAASTESGSMSGRPKSINTALPVRTPSIHSARLVDVPSPRSPRSRQGSLSVDRRHSQDHHQTQNNAHHHHAVVVLPPASITNSRASAIVSRTNSFQSQPAIAEENAIQTRPEQRAVAPSPLSREVASASTTPSGTHQRTLPIQYRPTEQQPLSDINSSMSLKALPGQAVTTPTESMPPIFGSVSHQSPHSSPRVNRLPASAATKVTILSSSHTGAFTDVEDRPGNLAKPVGIAPAQHSRREVRDLLPPVPERSSTRQMNAVLSPQQQQIGKPSVDRPVHGRDSSDRRSADNRHAPRTRNHGSDNSASSALPGKYKPMRTSEENTKVRPGPRDFEELMKSDQTIQYTLTPENMRDIDVSSVASTSNASLSNAVKVRMNDEPPQPTPLSRPPSDNKWPEVKRNISVNRPTNLASHPTKEFKGPVPRSPPVAAGASRASQARDARGARESVADFAKWIRNTGPGNAVGTGPPISVTIGGMRNVVGPGSTPVTPNPDTKSRLDTAQSGSSSSNTRLKLRAREPTVSSKDETSDLIDFIRRGPPSDNPRIPRVVAPFRTTMDSDQLAAAVGGKAVDANLPEVRYSGGTAQTEPSVHSSVDSRSALLSYSNKPGRANGGHGGVGDDGPPRRTRRGPPDPYAIDFSDEDSDADLFDRPPAKPAAKEESLADFLRNYEPPPRQESQPSVPPKPKKKSSAPSLMARFTRSHSHNASAGRSVARSTSGSSDGFGASRGRPKATNSSSRGYIPIQVKMPHGSETYGNGPGYSTGLSNLSAQPGPAVSGHKITKKRFEPREPFSNTTTTSDLENFLRNPPPPEPGVVSNAPNTHFDSEGSGKPARRRMKF